jgi:hypothetical protein
MLDDIVMNGHRSLHGVYSFRLADAILSLPGVNYCKLASELPKIGLENHILSGERTLKCLWMVQLPFWVCWRLIIMNFFFFFLIVTMYTHLSNSFHIF